MQNDKLLKFKEKFAGMNTIQKVFTVIAIILAIAASYLLCALLVGQLFKPFNPDYAGNALMFGLFRQSKVSLLLWLAMMAFIVVSLTSNNLRNSIQSTENGISIAKNKVGGTAEWMNEAEIKSNFHIGDIKSSNTILYGKMDKKGYKRIVTFQPPKGSEGNRNTLVVASMGSGKTYTFVIPNLIQTILRGDSFVCTDPKGELFSSLAQWCSEMGVEVHLLNLDPDNIKYSEFWNCLQETINPETERCDPTGLNDFVNIYMQNSGNGKEDFWYNSALNLVKAVIGYIAYNHESDIIDGYVTLYERITGESDENNPVIHKMKNTMCSFKWIKQTIRAEALKNGFDETELDKIFYDIEKIKPKFKYNIGEVVDALLNFDSIEDKLAEIPDWHPAAYSYAMYKTNDTETVRKSALQGAQLRFALFSDPNVKEVLSHDGISINDINGKQSAFFVIISDKVNTLKPIASLFFSFMFKDLQANYEKNGREANKKGVKNPCHEVTVMLEEFFSIGVICGSPEEFGRVMATCRSRKLYVSIIIQYIAQIEALYGPFIKDAIQGGCSTLYYLGGNDPTTLKFISDFAGRTTVITESHQEGASLLSKTGTNVSVSAKERPLITTEDARLWKDRVLLIKQWCQPAKLYPFGWDNHYICYKGKGDHPKGMIHLVSKEIKYPDGSTATLWNVASDSFTSFEEYIEPIETRVLRIIDKQNSIGDTEEYISDEILGLEKVKLLNDVVDENAETEVLFPEDILEQQKKFKNGIMVSDTSQVDDLQENHDNNSAILNPIENESKKEANENTADYASENTGDVETLEPDLDAILADAEAKAENTINNQVGNMSNPEQMSLGLVEDSQKKNEKKKPSRKPSTNVANLGRGNKQKTKKALPDE